MCLGQYSSDLPEALCASVIQTTKMTLMPNISVQRMPAADVSLEIRTLVGRRHRSPPRHPARRAMNSVTALALLVVALVGCGQSSSTGGTATSGPTLDEIIPLLKTEYYPKTPKTPAYVSGQPPLIPIAQLATIFSAYRSEVDFTKAACDYCNLTPSQWVVLRTQTQTVYLVAWSPIPDASGGREVATVDLKTDVFETWTCGASDFTNRLAQMEGVIRSATGQEGFSLGFSQKP